MRLMCTTRLIAEAICWRIARSGMFRFAIATIVSSRYSASRALLAWTVVRLPSWPVFIACSMSRASSPRTSPTMMRSGRMRRALMTNCRCLTAPLPSMLGGRVSRRTTWRWRSVSSAASSIVTMRSLSEMNPDSTLSSVVFPAPVPPDTMTLVRQATAARTKSSIGCVSESRSTRSCAPSRSVRNRRIDSTGPSSARGGMMALTREPSASLASTIGLDSSMRRPTELTIRSMIRSRCASSLNDHVDRLEHAVALDVHLVEAVHQDVRDLRVGEQFLERPEAEQFVEDVADERLPLEEAQRDLVALGVQHPHDHAADLGFRLLAADAGQALQVEPVQQPLVNPALQFLVLRVSRVDASGSWRNERHASASVGAHERPVSRPKMLLPLFARLDVVRQLRQFVREHLERARQPGLVARRRAGGPC